MNILKLFKTKKRMKPLSFRAGMDLCDLPVVTLTQEGEKFNFLLDTGSNDSIIDKKALERVKHGKREAQRSLFGLGAEKEMNGICEATFEFSGLSFPYEYLIADMSGPFAMIKQDTGVSLHGIIGAKFFNKFKYVLDFDKLIAYSKE